MVRGETEQTRTYPEVDGGGVKRGLILDNSGQNLVWLELEGVGILEFKLS